MSASMDMIHTMAEQDENRVSKRNIEVTHMLAMKKLWGKMPEKGRWVYKSDQYLLAALHEETTELATAMRGSDVEAILDECKDVINVASMIADKKRRERDNV